MTKVFFYFLLISLSFFSTAQQCLQIDYTYKERGFDVPSTLKSTQKKAYYHRKQGSEVRTEGDMEFYLNEEELEWSMGQNRLVTVTEINPKYSINSSWQAQDFSWEIKDEYKEILGVKVQKAVAKPLKIFKLFYSGGSISYDEEKVIAWFAVELPYSCGPEGYYGLPGAILGLEYTERKTKIIATKIDVTEGCEIIQPKKIGVEISKEQFYDRSKIDKKWMKKQMKALKKAK